MKKPPNKPFPAADNPHLREFLARVHGYDTPPSIWELSQLAAMVGGPDGAPQPLWEQAKRRVELAAHLWEAAAHQRQEIVGQMDRTAENFTSRAILYGPLKVGSHLMPRIQWKEQPGVIAFKTYLEQVIGLAREEDRMMWWRAYMEAKTRTDRHHSRWGSSISPEDRAHPDWCEPLDFPLEAGLLGEIIVRQREEGFPRGFPACYHAEGFRLWRFGMKTAQQPAAKALSLKEASKKGLEAESDSGS